MAWKDSVRTHDSGIDAVKGLLILLVVFGHIRVLQQDLRPLYDLIYTFHVSAFLLLLFAFPSPKLSWDFLKTRFIRYAVPFFWFFTFSTVIFYVMFLYKDGVSPLTTFKDYLLDLLIASSPMVDAASGLKRYWFLPALLSLVILRACWQSLGMVGRSAMLFITVLTMLLAGDMGEWRYYVPWGLIIAGFIFPLGFITKYLLEHEQSKARLFNIILPLAAFASLYLSWKTQLSINLGDITLKGVLSDPSGLAIHLLAMVSVTAAIMHYRHHLALIPSLAWFGSLSLPIYLLHSFFSQALEVFIMPRTGLTPLESLWITFPLTVVFSGITSWYMYRHAWIKQLVFPKDAQSLSHWYKDMKTRFG